MHIRVLNVEKFWLTLKFRPTAYHIYIRTRVHMNAYSITLVYKCNSLVVLPIIEAHPVEDVSNMTNSLTNAPLISIWQSTVWHFCWLITI
jgi:hypothetical protein